MTSDVIHYRFRLRRGLAATWATTNDVLLDGEIGLETDTGLRKVGDGNTSWNQLLYQLSGEVYGLPEIIDGDTIVWDATNQRWTLVKQRTFFGDGRGQQTIGEERVILATSIAIATSITLKRSASAPVVVSGGIAPYTVRALNALPLGVTLDASKLTASPTATIGTTTQYFVVTDSVGMETVVQTALQITPPYGSGTQWTAGGSFTIDDDQTVFILVVGGGGGGGCFGGGGGGGGGVIARAVALASGTYKVTVGAGGPGPGTSGSGSDGGDSSIETICVATGGQGGRAGGGGASGGNSGEGRVNDIVVNAAHVGKDYNAGGGAGAGQDTPSHNGGDGLLVTLPNNVQRYFGGGGGGSVDSSTSIPGGQGGGGAGSRSGTITPGADGLGGGGGGSWSTVSATTNKGGAGTVVVWGTLSATTGTSQTYTG